MAALDDEHGAAVAALALLRSGKWSAGALASLLKGLTAQADGAAVLAAAGLARAAVNASMASAERDLDAARASGIRALPCSSPHYPEALKRLVDAPPLLYLRGPLERLQPARTVALVGTRRATANGQAIASRLAAWLIDKGWTVLSGVNPGIDAAVQTAASAGGHAAVAVVAQGLDRDRPRVMAEAMARVLAAGGALVSEQAPGVPAEADALPASHRLQVGLSIASVLIEGGRHGGSAPHAEFRLREGHGLFAVVPEGVATQSELPRWLVAERGAQAIQSRSDYPALLDSLERLAGAQAA